jgi:hypothetical protein
MKVWTGPITPSYTPNLMLRRDHSPGKRSMLHIYKAMVLHPDEGGAKFLRNVGSYKSHTA